MAPVKIFTLLGPNQLDDYRNSEPPIKSPDPSSPHAGSNYTRLTQLHPESKVAAASKHNGYKLGSMVVWLLKGEGMSQPLPGVYGLYEEAFREGGKEGGCIRICVLLVQTPGLEL